MAVSLSSQFLHISVALKTTWIIPNFSAILKSIAMLPSLKVSQKSFLLSGEERHWERSIFQG